METKANTIIEAIIIITSIFTLVAVFVIIYFVYFNRKKTKLISQANMMKEAFQQQLLQSQVEVQEQTFQVIGKELHDNVGQLLSSSKMLLGITERGMKNPPDTLLTATDTLNRAINELRSLSKSLDKEWLEQFNFSENLRGEIARINAGHQIKAVYKEQNEITLDPEEQIILFRIVQEAIQNAIKHAQPKTIVISVFQSLKSLYIHISDDGKGVDNKITNQGMGAYQYEASYFLTRRYHKMEQNREHRNFSAD